MTADSSARPSPSAISTAIRRIRIVPVMVIDDAERAAETAAALAAGGIGCAEVTLRTPAGLAAITAMRDAHPHFVVGAGTVLTSDQVDAAVDAGATFVVSPGFDDAVVARALERGVLVVPGVATATEVQRARAAGVRELKLFPAGQLGGLDLISALAGPFADVQFLPSGGISLANVASYIASPAVFAVSGSWMVPRDALLAGDWDRIERLSAEAVRALEEPQ